MVAMAKRPSTHFLVMFAAESRPNPVPNSPEVFEYRQRANDLAFRTYLADKSSQLLLCTSTGMRRKGVRVWS
jgi:hypothetical protein